MSIAEQLTALAADKIASESSITEKSGTLSQNSGFDTFATDIRTIPQSISGYTIEDIAEKSISGNITCNSLAITSYAFRNCNQIANFTAPNATTVGENAFNQAMTDNTGAEMTFPEFLNADGSAFYGCLAWYFTMPKLQTCGTSCFSYCRIRSKVGDNRIRFPALTAISERMFQAASYIQVVDFTSANSIAGQAFYSCSNLTTLIFRSNSVVTLSNTNAFTNTIFATSATGEYGKIYVPSALISQYETETNWSALHCDFVAIEGSEYET